MGRPDLPSAVAVLGLVATLAGAPQVRAASAALSVAFVEPDRFADIGRLRSDREQALDGLRAAFESLAAARLPTGQSLRIEVLNVDLAGFVVPSTRSPGIDVRMRRGGNDPALIEFRWVLSDGVRVVASGQERLVDVDTSFQTDRDPDSALGLERAMIARWFDERIGRPADAAQARP